MTQYLVMYQPNDQNEWFPSLHVWPEILTMLIKAEETGGQFRFYRLDKGYPDRLWAVQTGEGTYYLGDMYRNHIEG